MVLLDPPSRSKFLPVNAGRSIQVTITVLCSALGLGACAGGIVTPGEDTPSVGSRAGSGGRSSGAAGRGGAAPIAPVIPDAGGVPDRGRGGAGGSGDDAPDASGPVLAEPRTYCDAYTDVFRVSCGPSCHQNVGVPIGDFGYEPGSALAYINRVSVRNAECGLIIDPANPLESLILTKVTGDYPRGMNCGAQMPVGSIEITDEQIDCLADWVQQFGESAGGSR